MSRYLRLRSEEGSRLGKGAPLAEGTEIPQHVTQPLEVGKEVPEVSRAQRIVEKADPSVLKAKEKKRKQQEKRSTGPSAMLKRRRPHTPSIDLLSSPDNSQRTRSASPINTAMPEDAVDGPEQGSVAGGGGDQGAGLRGPETTSLEDPPVVAGPYVSGQGTGTSGTVAGAHGVAQASAFVGGGFGRRGSGEPFIPGWSLPLNTTLNDAAQCQDMMSNLAPPFILAEQEDLADDRALYRGWFELCHGTMAITDVFKRFERLSHHYADLYKAHSTCSSFETQLSEAQNNLRVQTEANQKLAQDNQDLRASHNDCGRKEEEMGSRLVALERELNELKIKDEEREKKVGLLEETLKRKSEELDESEREAAVLRADFEKLAVTAGHEEIVRFNYVKELIPAVVRRLHGSDEYQQAWGRVFNAAIDSGYLDGLKVGRSDEEVEGILATQKDFDMEAVKGFVAAYDEMFLRSFPYIDKIKRSYHLPLADLMNVLPEGTGATPGAGTSGES